MNIAKCSFCSTRISDVYLVFKSEDVSNCYICTHCIGRMVDKLNNRITSIGVVVQKDRIEVGITRQMGDDRLNINDGVTYGIQRIAN